MKADYQQMEEGGTDDIKKTSGITINYDPSHKRQNLMKNLGNLSSLMKSRISTEISPKAFIMQFKFVYCNNYIHEILSCFRNNKFMSCYIRYCIPMSRNFQKIFTHL